VVTRIEGRVTRRGDVFLDELPLARKNKKDDEECVPKEREGSNENREKMEGLVIVSDRRKGGVREEVHDLWMGDFRAWDRKLVKDRTEKRKSMAGKRPKDNWRPS